MNSHQRRTLERYWPHGVYVEGIELTDACYKWLTDTFGSCKFTQRRMPRWCCRPEYQTVSFAQYSKGMSVFFRKEKDYVAFLLKWDQ